MPNDSQPTSVPSVGVAPNAVGNVATKPQPAGTVVVDPKAAPASQKGITPAVEETFEVQVDGKAQRLTKKEIIDAYQLRQLSDRRRSEADKVLAEYQKLQEVSKRDPIKFMKAMGYDFDGLATSYLARKAEDAMKDPKVLEVEQLKAENEQYKKWVDEQNTNLEHATKQKAVQIERERIHTEIIQAIEEAKDMGLPVDEELVIAIAQQMLVQDKAKKPLNAKEALPATYAKTQKWLQGLAAKMEGENLVKWLGEDTAKKIRKYDLTMLKAKRAVPSPGTAVKPASETKPVSTKPYETWSSFKARKLDTLK